MKRKSVYIVASAALVGGAAALRLAALPPALPDLDAVNFARALTSFDLASQQPHFPGYPVYVFLARAFAATGLGEVAALAAPGLLLGVAAVAGLGAVLRRQVGEAGAFAAAAVVGFAPLAVLQGALPHSDGAGFAALVLALAAALAAAAGKGVGPLAAGMVAGLTLGIRPSYLPALVALPLLFAAGLRLRWIAGLTLGTGLWLAPLVLMVGPARFVEIAGHFLAGHAGEWGGTVIVRPELAERLTWLGFDLGAAGLGLPWSGAVEPARILLALLLGAGAVALVAARQPTSLPLRAALLVALPYGAWAFLGQNLIKARHVLPLLAAAALLVALLPGAVARWRSDLAPAMAGALALLLAVVALPLAREQGRVPTPGAQLVHHVAATLPPAGASYFTGEEARLFERYAPHYRAGRLAGGDELAAAAGRLAQAGVQVYVSSAAPGYERLRPQLEEVARFSTSRLVRAHANPIVLYRYLPAVAGGGELP